MSRIFDSFFRTVVWRSSYISDRAPKSKLGVHCLKMTDRRNCDRRLYIFLCLHPNHRLDSVLTPQPCPPLTLALPPVKQISNFDERLHPLLKNLGVYDSFDFVLTSRYKQFCCVPFAIRCGFIFFCRNVPRDWCTLCRGSKRDEQSCPLARLSNTRSCRNASGSVYVAATLDAKTGRLSLLSLRVEQVSTHARPLALFAFVLFSLQGVRLGETRAGHVR